MVAQRVEAEVPRNTILQGDALSVLRALPDGCIQTVVTSPPYYGLRDYGVEGQIGLEETPADYISTLIRVFREVGRVMRSDATLWVNIGDSYANDTKWGGGSKPIKNTHSAAGGYHGQRQRRETAFPPKSLMLMPMRFAIAMQDEGWTVRSDIIWAKDNTMPEAVKDRPTKAHEYVFLFSKGPRYYYDAAAIKEAVTGGTHHPGKGLPGPKSVDPGKGIRGNHSFQAAVHKYIVDKRNARTIWSIPASPFTAAHFATFPPELPRRCILAGSHPGDLVLDPFAGAGTTLMVAKRLGRDYLGIELNPDYILMAEERILRDTLPPAMKHTKRELIPSRLFEV